MNALRFLTRLRFIPQRRRIELYPPFWLMRVKIIELSSDWQHVRIKLPLNMFSKNMGGSMFGGYQASLADPIAALACVARFPGYAVWTRAMHIDFVREGNSDLELRFEFPAELTTEIEQHLAHKNRSTPTFEYGFYRADGCLCTIIKNTVAIRPSGYSTDK